MDLSDLPSDITERVSMLEVIMTESATGGSNDDLAYKQLRREFMDDPILRPLLPSFVRTYRSLGAFWPFIKNEASTYAERRSLISLEFTPIMDYLEGQNYRPADSVASDVLEAFSVEDVHRVWTKALNRRDSDPEGAITSARTLIETVCLRILDDLRIAHSDRDDLPKLYKKVAEELNLAPTQHSQQAIKSILGGAMNMVNGIGTLRNRLSDSHGKRDQGGARPSTRHANLAVNTAGALATFLVETHLARK